jgi:DNA-binding NarL/FixJ family response regulator
VAAQLPDDAALRACIGQRFQREPGLDSFVLECIIVLTTYSGDAQVLRALRAGALAYILKVHDRELIETVHVVMEGQKRIPPEVASELPTDDVLSAREIEVLQLIAVENSNKQIANRLFVAEATIKSHVTSILSKLSANDRAHAVTTALKRDIMRSSHREV